MRYQPHNQADSWEDAGTCCLAEYIIWLQQFKASMEINGTIAFYNKSLKHLAFLLLLLAVFKPSIKEALTPQVEGKHNLLFNERFL